jgi:hypothetical protein
MLFNTNDRVVDSKGNEGVVSFVHFNRAMQETSYTITWNNGMSGSFTDKQIHDNYIYPLRSVFGYFFQSDESLST